MRDAEARETLATVTRSPALVRGFSRLVADEDIERSLYLAPLAGLPATGAILPAFEVLIRLPGERVVSTIAGRSDLLAWADSEGSLVHKAVKRRLAGLESRCPSFAGLAMDGTQGRPHVMGIVNATPDSFSDGGRHLDPHAAVDAALAMVDAGATIIDVGGESTRPGADAVSPDEEIRRVVPVVQALAERGVLVSIDTRHAAVMQATVAAGAGIINDVTALTGDADSLAVAARLGVPVILMHMIGDPRTMQDAPRYRHAPLDVYDALADRVAACLAAGVPREALAVDVGIGFAKSVQHNTEILARLGMYHGLGCAQLLGVSRKSYIGRLSRGEPPLGRVPGSLATAVTGAGQGVQMIRVHDVAETVQALTIWHAIARSGPAGGDGSVWNDQSF